MMYSKRSPSIVESTSKLPEREATVSRTRERSKRSPPWCSMARSTISRRCVVPAGAGAGSGAGSAPAQARSAAAAAMRGNAPAAPVPCGLANRNMFPC